jgi:hypothetical protein
MKDLEVNIIFILELHMTNKSMSNNYKNEGSRIQKSKVDLLGVLAKSIEIFAQSSIVFAQSLDLLAQPVEKSV